MTVFQLVVVLFWALGVAGILAHLWLKAAFAREIAATKKRVLSTEEPFRSARIGSLPAVVRRFAERAGASSDRAPPGAFFRQAVQFRPGRNQPFGPLTAEQTVSFHHPAFAWIAEQRRGPLVTARVIDSYLPGGGFLRVRLMGSIPVLNLEGPEASRGELMRYLAELAWAPDAVFHNPAIRFRELGPDSVEVEADSAGAGPVQLRLVFDTAGDLVEVQSDDRGSLENGKVVRRPWHGRFWDYREMGRRRIPVRAEVGWVYEEGYEAYFRGEITEYRICGEPS